ncbi:SPASM domain-containing protein [bacterium]|nr:SPASM domain-containing protein [bacterium]
MGGQDPGVRGFEMTSGLLIPAIDLKWFEPIGEESLFAAVVKRGESCEEIRSVYAAVTPQTRAACENEIGKIGRPITLIEASESTSIFNISSILKLFQSAIQVMNTPWMTAPLPPLSTFFDSDAFKFALEQASRNNHVCVINGAFTGWQMVLIHRSLHSKMPELISLAESRPTISPHELFTSLNAQYGPAVTSYRADISKKRGRKPDSNFLSSGLLDFTYGGMISAYRKIGNILKEPVSHLDVYKILTLQETSDFLETHRIRSLWLEVSAVNDHPAIYSPLNHWRKPDTLPPYMTPEIFDRIYTLAGRERIPLHLSGLGEPLQNPSFPDILNIVKRAAERQAPWSPIHIYTDGRCLTEEIARELLHPFVYSVMISLDAVDQEHYLRVRPGGDFHTVRKNIHRFLELKRHHLQHQDTANVNPVVALTTTLIAELDDHIDEFMSSYTRVDQYMARLGKNPPNDMKVSARRQYYREGHMVEHLVIQGASTYAGQTPDKRLAVYTPLKRFMCSRLARSVFIKTDGSIVLCDRVFAPSPDTRIANVMEVTSFQDIWDQMESGRRLHREGRYSEVYDRCGQCEDWSTPVD